MSIFNIPDTYPFDITTLTPDELLNMIHADSEIVSRRYGDAEDTLLFGMCMKLNYECSEVLLKHGADPNFEDVFGTTILSILFSNRFNENVDIYSYMKLLLDWGANPSHIDRVSRMSYLHSLCELPLDCNIIHNYRAYSLSLIKLFLEHDADPNIKDANGYIPLHYAIKNNNFEAVKILLEYHTDSEINNFICDAHAYNLEGIDLYIIDYVKNYQNLPV